VWNYWSTYRGRVSLSERLVKRGDYFWQRRRFSLLSSCARSPFLLLLLPRLHYLNADLGVGSTVLPQLIT